MIIIVEMFLVRLINVSRLLLYTSQTSKYDNHRGNVPCTFDQCKPFTSLYITN